MRENGLKIFRVDNLSVHGGSNRIYASYIDNGLVGDSVRQNINEEMVFGLDQFETYQKKFSAELVLSLDVIYHLVEDDVYCKYLTNVFSSAKKFVVIYSTNEEVPGILHSRHVRHRNFTRHIEEWFPAWELKDTLKNNQLKSYTKGNGPSVDFFVFQAR